jgi:hypothetical protein
MENIEDYSPYCAVCSGCGEDGCCSVMKCTFEDGCQYKQTYLNDLRDSYVFMREFYQKIYPNLTEEIQKDIDELYMSIEL